MSKATTINIDLPNLKRLTGASIALSTSRTALISVILKYMSRKPLKHFEAKLGIEYQPRSLDHQWHVFHLRLSRDEYDFFQDMRRICKMSISYIIAFAIQNYLNEIIKLFRGKVDSYRYHNYAIMQINIGDVICWAIYWGIPDKLLKVPSG